MKRYGYLIGYHLVNPTYTAKTIHSEEISHMNIHNGHAIIKDVDFPQRTTYIAHLAS